MKAQRILKTKYYLCTKDERGYRVRLDLGPFDTETKAYNVMYRPAPPERQCVPNSIMMERKPEFNGVIPVKGKRIIDHPRVYRIDTEGGPTP